jgi:hypothetical protein
MNLSELMDFGHVVTVHKDGTFSDGPVFLHAPELWVDDDGTEVFMPGTQDWTLLSGYTRQEGYRGPVNHASEFIGGGLEQDILATPGHYVAIIAYTDVQGEYAGWAIAFHPTSSDV